MLGRVGEGDTVFLTTDAKRGVLYYLNSGLRVGLGGDPLLGGIVLRRISRILYIN